MDIDVVHGEASTLSCIHLIIGRHANPFGSDIASLVVGDGNQSSLSLIGHEAVRAGMFDIIFFVGLVGVFQQTDDVEAPLQGRGSEGMDHGHELVI